MTGGRPAWASSLRREHPTRQAAVTASNGATSVLLGVLVYGLIRHGVLVTLFAAVLLLVAVSWSGRLLRVDRRRFGIRRVLEGLPWLLRHPGRSPDVWVLQLARLAALAVAWMFWRHLWAGALLAGALVTVLAASASGITAALPICRRCQDSHYLVHRCGPACQSAAVCTRGIEPCPYCVPFLPVAAKESER